MRAALLGMVAATCTRSTPRAAEPTPSNTQHAQPTREPEPCGDTIELKVSDSASPRILPARTYDTAGAYICLELDARSARRAAELSAGTPYEARATSSFELTLLAADGATLRKGWDLAAGTTEPQTSATIEYVIEQRTVLTAKLLVRAKSGTATAAVDLELFEPYE